MNKMLIPICLLISASAMAQPQNNHPNAPESPHRIEAQRKYSLIVREGNDSSITEFNRGLASTRGARGMLGDLAGLYRSTFTGQIISASSSLLETGISAIVNAAKDKRPEWQSAVQKESQFIRFLPMQTEILDFYKKPSVNGPLDPTDMLFSGFGCRQVIEFINPEGIPEEKEVFYVSCKVKRGDTGYSRMLNHSKFEVYVDSLRFNPYLCDLPNDSLGVDTDKRIGFSFEKRRNLRFNILATISSSWINQAMQVHDNVKLGEFDISASISPDKIDKDGYFVYSHNDSKEGAALVTVTGDCFLVPRSYVGSSDMSNATDSWGTGQYKVEMRISETCQINPEYYMTDGKWDKTKWNPEWKLIKSRRKPQNQWNKILNIIGAGYTGTEWITTLAEPMKTYIIQTETGLLNSANSSMPTTKAAAMPAKK